VRGQTASLDGRFTHHLRTAQIVGVSGSYRRSGGTMLTKCLVRLPLLATVACVAGASPAHGHPNAPRPVIAPAGELDITFDVEVGEPLMLAGQEQSAYIKITLGGFALPQQAQRPPINLALVLDRSSSMAGDRLAKAKEAALMVLDRLHPDDIISIVTYDSGVEVLVPATKASQIGTVRERISALQPQGMTALFAGVTHGLEEVGKYLDDKRVNRVILLSDGQANVGPRSPNELGRLGAVAGKQGISITTIGLGLGYNEDLMTQLAMASDGNHGFAESADDLATLFNHELGDIMSVVARDVEVEISFAAGITPVRALGRDATITGRKARLNLSQLYAKQQKHVLFEVKVPPSSAGKKRQLADVAVKYANMISKKPGTKRDAVAVEFSAAKSAIAQRQNRQVIEAAVEAIATETNRQAVVLRDQGKVAEAQKVLQGNAVYLERESQRLQSTKLKQHGAKNAADAKAIGSEADWTRTRKDMRREQYKSQNQQGW
jgi:Ca-activated chloride channel homolog